MGCNKPTAKKCSCPCHTLGQRCALTHLAPSREPLPQLLRDEGHDGVDQLKPVVQAEVQAGLRDAASLRVQNMNTKQTHVTISVLVHVWATGRGRCALVQALNFIIIN